MVEGKIKINMYIIGKDRINKDVCTHIIRHVTV